MYYNKLILILCILKTILVIKAGLPAQKFF
jgi:hypothetical protein